ncbi:MAG: hypothetical protein ACI398_06485 [Clostridium sp.]
MDDFGCMNELNCEFNNLNNSINDLNNTLGMNQRVNDAFDAGELNGLQGFGMISRQYQALILLLIILYWWTTQFTANYFMNSNNQLICNMSCTLDKLVDSTVTNLCKCCNRTLAEADEKKGRHKKHHKCRCSDCCDCECDSDCC